MLCCILAHIKTDTTIYLPNTTCRPCKSRFSLSLLCIPLPFNYNYPTFKTILWMRTIYHSWGVVGAVVIAAQFPIYFFGFANVIHALTIMYHHNYILNRHLSQFILKLRSIIQCEFVHRCTGADVILKGT
uniref:Solute carrier family 43 member 3-like n=1 Tax=Phallusia mammillata TaxID=59560 RepID=A0A6F9DS57_9ASCI|nr:solute carrier family 43 member 3-like [Phallusia mammillata]